MSFLLLSGGPFFFTHASPFFPVRGLWEFLHILIIFFFNSIKFINLFIPFILTNHSRGPSTANQTNHSCLFSLKQVTSECLRRPLLVSSLHLPGRYYKTTTQQPAPTVDQLQLNPAAVPSRPSYSICIT